MHDGSQDVEHVAEEPDDDELDREAVCARAAEVFDDLGGEDDYPAGDGDGAADAGYGLDVEVEGCGWGGHGGGAVGLVCSVVGVYGGCCKEEG